MYIFEESAALASSISIGEVAARLELLENVAFDISTIINNSKMVILGGYCGNLTSSSCHAIANWQTGFECVSTCSPPAVGFYLNDASRVQLKDQGAVLTSTSSITAKHGSDSGRGGINEVYYPTSSSETCFGERCGLFIKNGYNKTSSTCTKAKIDKILTVNVIAKRTRNALAEIGFQCT